MQARLDSLVFFLCACPPNGNNDGNIVGMMREDA